MTATGSPSVEAAALWLATVPVDKRPRPIIPHIKREFPTSVHGRASARGPF